MEIRGVWARQRPLEHPASTRVIAQASQQEPRQTTHLPFFVHSNRLHKTLAKSIKYRDTVKTTRSGGDCAVVPAFEPRNIVLDAGDRLTAERIRN